MSVDHDAVMAAPQATAERKCCGKCAFRVGSQERRDPYGWMLLLEAWDLDGVVFLCHESVPGHHQEVVDERPRSRRCAGWEACSKSGRWPKATPDQAWINMTKEEHP